MSTDLWWPAPHVASPIDCEVRIPGSKSITNRALVLAALSDGPSVIESALRSRDTELMAGALSALGADIAVLSSDESNMTVQVSPQVLPAVDSISIDVGLAGTVMRFLPPVAGFVHGDVAFDGDPAARRRPMATLIEAMRDVGMEVDDANTGRLPFTVHGRGRIPGGEVVLDASRSSQFVSALLLSSGRFDAGATIHHVGPAIPSTPHIDMTIHMLAKHGVGVRTVDDPPIETFQRHTWHVDPVELRARDWIIEPDISNALPFIAAAIVTGGRIQISGWPSDSLQPTDDVLGVLTLFGARIDFQESGLIVQGPDTIHPVDVDLSDIGETAPTMAAIALFADGRSVLRGIAHLRGHETDRLAALEREISGLGGSVEQTDDGLIITARDLGGGRFHTHEDHRMATTAAIIGLRTPGVLIENVGTTAKTLPAFTHMWSSLVDGT